MIRANARIYIDTTALMDTAEMRLFIEKAADILRAEGKKLIVTRAVRSELARHLGSNNKVKQALTMNAISIINEYEDLFQIEGGIIDDGDVSKAFADAALLAELTLNKSIGSQLLITNDKKLSKDAYVINQQESCKGRKVMVCYINKGGDLMRSRCTFEGQTQEPAEKQIFESTIPNDSETVTVKSTPEKKTGAFIPVLTFVFGSIAGIVGTKVAQRYL